MTLSRLMMCLFLKGILAEENETEPYSGVQLWRAQGYLDEEVVEEFYDRARFTEDIWKRNNRTIDFLVQDEEIEYITEFLNSHNVKHKVLIKNVKGQINDTVVNKIHTRRKANVPQGLLFKFGVDR